MTVKRFILISAFVLLAGLVWFMPDLTAKGLAPAAASRSNAVFIQHPIEINTKGASHLLHVDIAANQAAWHQGMMHRKAWGGIEGMLFVFDSEAPLQFWMKDTILPLDIIFFDNTGQVTNIVQHAEPYSTRHIPSLRPARYVLELPAGDAARLGLTQETLLNISTFIEVL